MRSPGRRLLGCTKGPFEHNTARQLQRKARGSVGCHEHRVNGRYPGTGWNHMTVETSAFRWSDLYSVNIAELDRQHQGFLAIVHELNQALATGEGAAVTHSILQRLVEYAHTHFPAEEALMTEHKFPALPPTVPSTTGSHGWSRSFWKTTTPARREFRCHSCCSCRPG